MGSMGGVIRLLGAGACAAALAVPGVTAAIAADRGIPLLVTYGKGSATEEGDHDFRQAIYFAVPATHEGPLHLRIFDPDTNHRHDTPFKVWGDTKTRFSLYGGDGAYSEPTSRADVAAATGGTQLAARSFGSSRRLDNRWVTIATVKAEQGQMVGDERVFRLDIEGLNGDDGNVFDVAVSTAKTSNAAPAGLRLFSFLPTFRVPSKDVLSELPFAVPKAAKRIKIHNFDSVGAKVAYTGRLRSVELEPAGQDEWLIGEVEPNADERGRVAAVTVEGGDEIPNDVTIFVTDGSGKALPVMLPIRAFYPNTRPQARAEITATGCYNVRLDSSPSTDDRSDPLRTVWRFHDGRMIPGAVAVRRYDGPGHYRADLEVTDASGLVGAAGVRTFDVVVKARPVARIAAEPVVPLGPAAVFDASGSLAPGKDAAVADAAAENASYRWVFSDGVELEGEKVERSFAKAGPYSVQLYMRDGSGHPCDRDNAEYAFRVNAAPVANAGPDQHVAVGQAVAFDGGASTDADGAIAAYRWDFGDGGTATGRNPSHSFTKPGTYEVALTVSDDAGIANSSNTDRLRVRVNAAPKADAGADRKAVTGLPVTFDGSASSDADGNVIAYAWDFGDGGKARGIVRPHTFWKPGTYEVKLTVQDDSGLANDTGTTMVAVTVADPPNMAPVADAGGNIKTRAGRIISFDAAASSDPDGNVVAYAWDFGNGASGHGIAPQFTYQTPGDYLVRLKVTDDRGGDAEAAIKVKVAPRRAGEEAGQ